MSVYIITEEEERELRALVQAKIDENPGWFANEDLGQVAVAVAIHDDCTVLASGLTTCGINRETLRQVVWSVRNGDSNGD